MTWKMILSIFAFSLLLGFTPSPPAQQDIQVFFRVVDIVTKQPIKEAEVRYRGKVLGYTQDNGTFEGKLREITPGEMLSFHVQHPDYLGTIDTFSSDHSEAFEFQLPNKQNLEQADRFIRFDKRDQPHQHYVPEPFEPTAVEKKVKGTKSTTYKLPTHITIDKGNGVTQKLTLEDYVKGVLPKEIGTSFPMEAMKAQAVAARTYVVNYTRGGTKSICITTKCQVWSSKRYSVTDQAVDATKGVVALHNGKISGGYFAASCGGKTINSEDKWNYRAYLRAVTCIENKSGQCSVVCNTSIKKNQTCTSGGSCTCWGIFGHRIGLCQRGAQAMGKCGKTYDQIVKHYYTGVTLANTVITVPEKDDAKLIQQSPTTTVTLKPGETLKKSWTVENTGNTDWDKQKGYAFLYQQGEKSLTSSQKVDLTKVISPQSQVPLNLTITAPQTEGTYKATWKIAKGTTAFGPELNIEIKVEKETVKPNCVDSDKDGYYAAGNGCKQPFDCNDNDAKIHPNAKEICGNGVDEDCKDGDQTCPSGCVDSDKDGYFASKDGCKQPFDCDDNNAKVHPTALEICGNGVDEDCKDGDLVCSSDCVDADKDGYFASKDGCQKPFDCDDTNAKIFPGSTDICDNGIDEDCQGGDRTCQSQPTKKKQGETGCKNNSDCEQGLVCALFKEKTMCTKSCKSDDMCPTGLYCLQQTVCWPKEKDTTKPACTKDADCSKNEACNKEGACEPKKQGCGCDTSSTKSGNEKAPTKLLFLLALVGLCWWRHQRQKQGGKSSAR